MTTNANPSINPADYDNLTGAFRHIFRKLLMQVDTMLPVRVIAFDRTAKPPRVQVQPTINILTTSNKAISRAQIASVPVIQLGGGGFFISFPINPGDHGFVLASDRDMSLFMQAGQPSQPNTLRIKNFADSVFIPAVLFNYTIAGEDDTNMVIQSMDGSVKITLGETKIKIAAPEVEIESPNTIVTTDDLTVNATNSITIDSPEIDINSSTGVNITTPTLAVVGNITATGDITPHTP